MKVRICPSCGSTNVKIPPAGLDIRMIMQDYCLICGERGTFPQVDKEKVEEFRKEVNRIKWKK